MKHIAIIGGGPAGLRAAEVAAEAGAEVTLFDAKPSVGRKFLVAGKGGMNLTHSEPLELFRTRYSGIEKSPEIWTSILDGFTPVELREWARELGAETFEAGSGRVYLKNLKAATLLRAWVSKLRSIGVRFVMKHSLTSLTHDGRIEFGFSNGVAGHADALILALGGASWPQTGSDARWTHVLESLGVSIQPLVAANCGWEHDWSAEFLSLAEGRPLKNITVRAGDRLFHGEALITRYGIEGGPVYALGRTLRGMPSPALTIDLKPAHSHEQLVSKMESVRRNFALEARQRWKLGDAAFALLARKEWADVHSLAHEAKNCVIPLKGPRPVAESISSAGGVCWSEIDSNLMLRRLPGIFVSGEMIDWEAPTGGYLLQGCFATGSLAAKSALAWIKRSGDPQ